MQAGPSEINDFAANIGIADSQTFAVEAIKALLAQMAGEAEGGNTSEGTGEGRMQIRSYGLVALCALGLAMPLAGCQTPEQSAMSAENTCAAQGLRGKRYERCVRATYNANRQQSQQAENAAAVGVAAGVIGGALIGGAIADNNHYHHHYYRHCYRCW